jgi:pimeloyl-ACP methyl ester carboxylesterase
MAQATAQLGLDTYALIGTSFEGRVALWQALQAPQQVYLLVLIAPTTVLPEGYTMPSVAPDQLGKLLFAQRKIRYKDGSNCPNPRHNRRKTQQGHT